MQMTLRSNRRINNTNSNRDRPLSSHSSHHSSVPSNSIRNYALRRANSSNLNCYSSSVCTSIISSPSNDRRRSINQLNHTDCDSACVTLRRTNSTNLTPNTRKYHDGTLNININSSDNVSLLRPSSTPAHSMIGESRRRRQLPQCPQADKMKHQFT